jgi:hypothetical protein
LLGRRHHTSIDSPYNFENGEHSFDSSAEALNHRRVVPENFCKRENQEKRFAYDQIVFAFALKLNQIQFRDGK